jgi:hypothetical protein
MEWVDHRNLANRPPASAILNSLEKSQDVMGSSVGIRCELVHIGEDSDLNRVKHRRVVGGLITIAMTLLAALVR